MNIKTLKQKFSFQSGYDQVKMGDVDKLTYDIMSSLGVVTKQTFVRRMNGGFFSPAEKSAITEIFSKYNITDNVWKKL